MVIIGTDRIKGVLELPKIKKQISKGGSIYISDKDYWSDDIQRSLRMGYIKADGKPNNEFSDEDPANRIVKCKNIHGRSISIPLLNQEVKPNQTFVIKEKDLEDPSIRAAISKGMIQILEIDGAKERLVDEESLDVSDVFEDEEDGNEEEEEEEDEGEEEVTIPKPVIDTNEEITGAIKEVPGKPKTKILNSLTLDSSKKNNESKIKTVIDINIADSSNPEPADSNKGDAKRHSVVANPNNEQREGLEATVWMGEEGMVKINGKKLSSSEPIKFADEEEAKSKRKKHPKLSKIKEKPNKDVSFLDPDQERIAKHPKLSKLQQNAEIDGAEQNN